ncbi:MAG: hypothetical protein LBO00_10180 [Zoogloeaceae bacterium]|nr:hypothetical protein [Zoogloeaceae bacterium]
MNFYPIYLFDSSRHQDLLPLGKIKDIETVAAAVRKLRDLDAGVNPRFVRLGARLKEYVDRFPVSNAQGSSGCFWLNDPAAELKRFTGAVWQPEMYDWDKIVDFFDVLFPLARMLRLDVYDEAKGVYLPAWDIGLPLEESLRQRAAYDPNFLKVETRSLTKDAIKKRFLEKLTGPLAEHGFKLIYVIEDEGDGQEPRGEYDGYKLWNESFTFHYENSGVDQVIDGYIHEKGVVRCYFKFFSGSQRLREIYIKHLGRNPDDIPPPYSGIPNLQLSLDKLLPDFQSGWNNPEEIELADTIEEVDWRVADILKIALPLMVKLRTLRGVEDFYYNEKEFEDRLNYLTSDSFSWALAVAETLHAHMIGNRERFEFLVQRIEKCLAQPFKDHDDCDALTYPGAWDYQKKYAALVDKCRKGIIPQANPDDPA